LSLTFSYISLALPIPLLIIGPTPGIKAVAVSAAPRRKFPIFVPPSFFLKTFFNAIILYF